MEFLYSPTARGFFLAAIHGDAVPEDARPVTQDRHAELMAGQAAGFEIAPDAMGDPKLVPRPVMSEADLLEAERARMVLTRLQFALQAMESGMMSAEDAEGFVGPRVIPEIGEAALLLIDDLPTQAVARIRFAGAQTIARLDPFIPALQAASELTDAQVDDFFRAGMLL